MTSLPPGLLLLLAGLACLLPLKSERARRLPQWLLLIAPLLSLLHVLTLPIGTEVTRTFLGMPTIPVRVDTLTRLWGLLFHFAAIAAGLYSLTLRDRRQHAAALAYAGAAIGAVYAGDLLTLFLYWELTGVTSVFLVWAAGTRRSVAGGLRYLLFQVGSGVLLLAGALMHYSATDSLAFDAFNLASPGTLFLFLAFGIKCGFPLFHTWLQDAYPQSTPTGAVWLSIFTTKLAIYALLRGFPGESLLIPIGLVMALYPLLHALIEDDLRRVVIYNLHNQLGFMVVAIGIGTPLALNGAAAHAFGGIFYIALLLMVLGVVGRQIGTTRASELGGLYRRLPRTAAYCAIAAASISAVPLFCGFASKSLILAAAAESHLERTWLLLLFASVGTILSSGVRVAGAFYLGDASAAASALEEPPRFTRLGMGVAAGFCLVIGIFPFLLYRLLPWEMQYRLFTLEHIVTQLQLLAWVLLTFIALRAAYLLPRSRPARLWDTDWFYRRAFPEAIRVVGGAGLGFWNLALRGVRRVLMRLAERVQGLHDPDGVFGRTWTTGTMVLFAAIFLCLYLLVYTFWS